MAANLELRLAHEDDVPGIEGLMAAAREWLSRKGTDQWQRSWPDDAARKTRMHIGVTAGKTWVVTDGAACVATITVDWHAYTPGLPTLWTEAERAEPAVYDHRMTVLRDSAYAGRGLGAGLLDWSGRLAEEAYGARAVRLDAWTTNSDLHLYYKGAGFDKKRTHAEEEIGCPSGALFEKPLGRCSGSVEGIVVDAADTARWVAAARLAHGVTFAGTES